MAREFTDRQLNEQVNKSSKEAEQLLHSGDQTERFLARLEDKLNKVPVVGSKLSNIPVLVSLVRANVRKEYCDVPLASIVAITSALIYFVSPLDLVPDIIPILGYVDDAKVVAFVWKMVESDVVEYKNWQERNGMRGLYKCK